MEDENLRILLEDCGMLLRNLIDPVMRKLQVASLERPETIERLKAMLDGCREHAERVDRRDAPAIEPPSPGELN
ncbi:MAG: hypothetical protein ACTHOU_09385 [Aureliella sp.]